MTIDGDSPTLLTNTQPSHLETGLGLLDYQSSKKAIERVKNKPRGKYTKYSDSQKHTIGKYASNTVQLVLYEDTKMSFLNQAKALFVQCEKKYEEEA